jgi:energy-coupling factor transporter transmembrane protein EcfT
MRLRVPHLQSAALGTSAYLACLAFSLAIPMLAQGWRLPLAFAFVLLLAGICFPVGLRILSDWRLLIFLVFVTVPLALLAEPKTISVGGVWLSQQGIADGLRMALRATAIAVGVTGFTASVSVGELSRLLERAGFKGLGFALGVAMNILPVIRDTTTTVYQSMWLRGGFKRRPLYAARLMLVTVVVQSLWHADNIVRAAEARAFSPERIRSAPLSRQPHDAWVYAALGVAAVALVV